MKSYTNKGFFLLFLLFACSSNAHAYMFGGMLENGTGYEQRVKDFKKSKNYFDPATMKIDDNTSLEDDDEDFEDEYTQIEEEKVKNDPLMDYNKKMLIWNDHVYRYTLNPAAKGYNFVFPEPVRQSIDNFFLNLAYPKRFVNSMLQLKGRYMYDETVRFVINSTIGVLGLFDPATPITGTSVHKEDFGQTLATWGVGGDTYVVWPLAGPATFRDTAGWIVDAFLNPLFIRQSRDLNLFGAKDATFWINAYDIFNYYSLIVQNYESLRDSDLNFYDAMKNVYINGREKEIKD